ncbi:MAG TPA: lysine exporter LysO family protein [Salinivirga sp.]|uniref:lysine exporter LysO family protein n=1 Tax=Salinivirga sp. TaxID=1970192 RepID=UPI002B484DCC|nr:lysine exporter LysO family protein [Salinivirga sp.]HKK58135.1 lysine exporter LysO family protein [Salinivirga sp.]
MRATIYILLFFTLGLLLSWQGLLPGHLLKNDYSVYALYLLMFLVGISIGADSSAFKVIKQVKLKILLVPLATIVGTFLGMILIMPFLAEISFTDLQAIGAGYGYYSLSSIIIAEMRTETLAVIALIANVIREIITLILTPILAKKAGKLAPVNSAGATSMDTTLPVITRYVGKEYAIISVFHGTVLTILVPVIVSLFLEMA